MGSGTNGDGPQNRTSIQNSAPTISSRIPIAESRIPFSEVLK
jgi:hypothetical protein